MIRISANRLLQLSVVSSNPCLSFTDLCLSTKFTAGDLKQNFSNLLPSMDRFYFKLFNANTLKGTVIGIVFRFQNCFAGYIQSLTFFLYDCF